MYLFGTYYSVGVLGRVVVGVSTVVDADVSIVDVRDEFKEFSALLV
jgi:hypothetical protein